MGAGGGNIHSNKTHSRLIVNSLNKTNWNKLRIQIRWHVAGRLLIYDAASAFCCTIVRMLWLRITLYSNWILYGNYPQTCCFVRFVNMSPPSHSDWAVLSDLIDQYFLKNCSLWSSDIYRFMYVLETNTYVVVVFFFFWVMFLTKLYCSLLSCETPVLLTVKISMKVMKNKSYVMPSTVLQENFFSLR